MLVPNGTQYPDGELQQKAYVHRNGRPGRRGRGCGGVVTQEHFLRNATERYCKGLVKVLVNVSERQVELRPRDLGGPLKAKGFLAIFQLALLSTFIVTFPPHFIVTLLPSLHISLFHFAIMSNRNMPLYTLQMHLLDPKAQAHVQDKIDESLLLVDQYEKLATLADVSYYLYF